MKKLFTLCLLMIATLSLSAKTIKEFVITTQPQMSCQNCENKIKKNIRFEKGVTNIQTDLQNQVVVVTYDADKTNETNLTTAFDKLGYKVAPTTKPEANAADSKSCPNKSTGCSKAEGCSKQKADGGCKDKAEKKCDGKCKDDGCKNKK